MQRWEDKSNQLWQHVLILHKNNDAAKAKRPTSKIKNNTWTAILWRAFILKLFPAARVSVAADLPRLPHCHQKPVNMAITNCCRQRHPEGMFNR